MTQALREFLTKKLATERSEVDRMYDLYNAPPSFLDPEVRRLYGNRVMECNVNLARLAADTLAQRLQVTGFRTTVGDPVDNPVTEFWRALGGPVWSSLAQLEAAVSGRAFLLLGSVDGEVTITPESPTQMTVTRDPATRAIVAAMKRYRADDGYTHSVVMTSDTIDTYVSRSEQAADPQYDYSPTVMGEDMLLAASQPNTLGVVPVSVLVNRPRLTMPDGQSDLYDLEPLLKALGKILTDMLTASEAAAMPRRWTSLPGDVTSEQASNIQDAVTKTITAPGATRPLVISGGGEMHQFETADLNNFDTAIRLLISTIASIASLPPYYTSGDAVNPTSADAIRASESRLTAKALERQRWWGPVYADVMRMAVLARDGRPDVGLRDLTTLWVDPAPSSVAQEADAAVKLYTAGITDRRAALEALDVDPVEIERLLATPPALAASVAVGDSATGQQITVNMPNPPRTRKRIETDDKGRIVGVIEEPLTKETK